MSVVGMDTWIRDGGGERRKRGSGNMQPIESLRDYTGTMMGLVMDFGYKVNTGRKIGFLIVKH